MNEPKIRFQGFEGEWEQRKVSEVAPLQRGFDLPFSQMEEGEYPVVMSNGIGGSHKDYKVKGPGVITGRSGTIGKVHYIEGDYWPHNTSLWVTDFKGNYPKFIYHLYQRIDLSQFGSGSGVPTLNRNDVHDSNVLVPSRDEQMQISTMLDHLDHLIILRQKKYDEIKKFKKYMLHKMFPKDGKRIPEVRFSGFTDAWEQRKLGEVFEQTTNFVNLDEGKMELWSLTVEEGLTPKSERYNREFLVKKDTNFKEVRPGDIVYNPMNMTLGAVGYNGMAKSVAVSGYYTTMVTNAGYDSYYINTWLKSPYAISLYKTFATGSLKEKQRVQFPTLSIIPTVFPESEEQKKIGLFFKRLDVLITLHQRKQNSMKNVLKHAQILI